MAKKVDDLEAVRMVAAALEPFGELDRDRIVRWANEKLDVHYHEDNGAAGLAPRPTGSIEKKTRSRKTATKKSETSGTAARPAGTQDDI